MTQRKILMKSLGVIGSDFGPFSQLILSSEDESILTAFVVVQSLSCAGLFVTPWTVACQASLSITNSWSLLKLMSIKELMPPKHLILCHPLLLCLQSFPASGSFPVNQFFTSCGQSIRASASAAVLSMNI